MMRGVRSTVALVVVLAGLSAYIYFVTWKKAPEGTAKDKVFASLQSDKIEELTVKSSSGATTKVKKAGEGWQIEAPVTAPADTTAVSGVTSALAALNLERVIDEKPGDLKVYGLGQPRIEVAFKAQGDTEPRQLQLGDRTPVGYTVFAKTAGSDRVFLIGAYDEGQLDKSTFDLRDKAVVKFERDKVDGIELASGSTTIDLARAGDGWTITKPVKAPGDSASVEGILGRVQSAQMKSVVTADATPEELKTFGLNKPAHTMTVRMGSASATLLVGSKADDNTTYARDASSPTVVTIESALADDLEKGVDEYRHKDIFSFRPYNATHFEITLNGSKMVLNRVKAQKPDADDSWRRVSPTEKDLDKDAANAMLSLLSTLRATSFVDSTANTGLDAPALMVVVRYGDGTKQEQATFGRTSDAAYVARPDEPGAAKLTLADFDDAVKTIDALAK
jgi:hypothetical protein